MLQSADLQPPAAPTAKTTRHTVLRAICMAGQRVEVGAEVLLTATQSADLVAAGKVARVVDVDPAGPAQPYGKQTLPRKPRAGTTA